MLQHKNDDDDAVEMFYDELEEIIKKTPKKDLLIITGDWNAEVGPDAHISGWGQWGRWSTRLLTAICQRVWKLNNGRMYAPNYSVMIPISEIGNLRLCQNYRTMSLISNHCKVMLRVLLN